IDDDSKMRRLLVRTLKSAGHSVHQAADGRKGLHLFQENPPALVITDIVMPDKEGIETIQALRRAASDLPILAISGSGEHGYLRFAMELGATATLAKPFGADDLLATVSRLLTKPAP
ncbi:MAG TPA: response regulator, partial [Stellaceae bacterium]|nr:response regulator [Stellaceae bacterium]